MAKVLVVDDEVGIRELLAEILNDEGHEVLSAGNAQEARAQRAAGVVDLVLLDIWMPDTDGVTLLKEWAATALYASTPVIMMSGHGTIDTAIEATRIGAIDFLEKPITMSKLLKAVSAALNRNKPQTKPAVIPFAQTSHHGITVHPVPALDRATAVGPAAPAGLDIPLNVPLREARDNFERIYFEHHLAREGWSMTRVAEKTGLERTHLYRKLKQLGIELARKNKLAQEL